MGRDEVEQLYATRAKRYEQVFVNQLGWGKELEAFFRQSDYLRPSLKVLDAGCGTGVVTRTLHKVMREKGLGSAEFHAFDLTQGMLDIFEEQITAQGLERIELAQADVLKLDSLPSHWGEHDLVVTSALLEHIPADLIDRAVSNLRSLLKAGGVLLLLVTRRTLVTRLTGKLWWKTNLFDEAHVKAMLRRVGFDRIESRNLTSRWSKFIIVVEARK